jgi:hypothetical protein
MTAVGGAAVTGATELWSLTFAPAHPKAATANSTHIRLRIRDLMEFLSQLEFDSSNALATLFLSSEIEWFRLAICPG